MRHDTSPPLIVAQETTQSDIKGQVNPSQASGAFPRFHQAFTSHRTRSARIGRLLLDGSAQGMSKTGGGGLARVPNLRVCRHPTTGWHRRRGEQGRSNVLPLFRLNGVVNKLQWNAWRKNRAACCSGKWPPRGTRTTVLTYPCSVAFSSTKRVRQRNRQGWRKR